MYRISKTSLVAPLLLLLATPLAAEVVGGVVLRVNDRVATVRDYQAREAAQAAALRQATLEPAEKARAEAAIPEGVVRDLLEELLILSRADQLGLSVSDLELQDYLQGDRERMGINTDDELRMALAQAGMTVSDYHSTVSKQLLWRKVMSREVFPRIQVPDEELRERYEELQEELTVPAQRRLEEVVVLEAADLNPAERQRIAEQVASAMESGESTEEAAAAFGEQVMAVEIGWVSPGDLASELETATWNLEPRAVTKPVSARGGLHVLRLLEARAESVRPFEEVRDQILAQERDQRMSTEMRSYLEELEAVAFIVGSLPDAAAGYKTASGRVLGAATSP